MSETKTWVCPNCPDNPEFEHEVMMQHLREVHKIEPKGTPAKRSLLMHACMEGGSLWQFEWEVGGLKFIQSVRSERDRTPAAAAPAPERPPLRRCHEPRTQPTLRLAGPKPANCYSDSDRMPFGKHKGAQMMDVPADYLDWLRGQDWIVKWPKVMNYIEWRMGALEWEQERKERSK